MVKDFLKLQLAGVEHEVFAVLHLDAQHRVVEHVEMFRGTVSEKSVYPREVVKDALKLNNSAVIFVHNHPSGSAEPSRGGRGNDSNAETALSLVDVRVIDHIIVAGCSTLSMAGPSGSFSASLIGHRRQIHNRLGKDYGSWCRVKTV